MNMCETFVTIMVFNLISEVRYEWSKFGTAAFIFPGHPYQFISMAGYLYFSEVQPTDNKQYFCFVTLAAPNNYKLTTKQPPMKISLGIWLMISDNSKCVFLCSRAAKKRPRGSGKVRHKPVYHSLKFWI